MLSKTYRLPAHVRLSHPKTYHSPLFLIKISPNMLSYTRFGFIVTKKIDKRAVVRNRIKRVFRSCIEEMREEIVPGKDMLFFLKQGILEIERKNVYNEIQQTLKTGNLLQ